MKKWLILLFLLIAVAMPTYAVDIGQAPEPESGASLLPEQQSDFASDLIYVLRNAFSAFLPDLKEGMGVCLRVFAVVMLTQMCNHISGISKQAVKICTVLAISGCLIGSANSMIGLASETVRQISAYGKLLLPVMTTALAAQGSATASTALYAGTAVFDSILTTILSGLFVPLIYGYIALVIANAATKEEYLNKMRDFAKWFASWSMKLLLYIFICYMSLTGVISGSTDQLALKAAKLTISGAVPVVGGMLSDASETILVSVSLMKNAAGIYGILAVIAIFIGPFLKIGAQYLLLKLTSFFCNVIGGKDAQSLIDGFSTAMGLLLAMTGVTCLLQLVSVVCFLRGVGL